MDSIARTYPDLYVTRIISAFRVPVVPGSLDHRERMETLKLVFFEDAPIDDPELLHAPVYTFRIVDYLSMYQDPSLDAESQQAAFIEAVDQIMVNTSHQSALRTFVVEFLLEGFDLLGMEAVLRHLAENYLDESCSSEVAELVKARMEAYEAMEVGSLAPDFVIRDVQGRNLRLSAMDKDYVLLIFWASTCVHCRHLMPELHQWYLDERHADLEVVALSIDTLEAHFTDFLASNPMEWITAYDPLGWNGKVARDYHIYATPSMFLLDRQGRILSRPMNLRQVKRSLKSIE
jgi:peroxiredoxin